MIEAITDNFLLIIIVAVMEDSTHSSGNKKEKDPENMGVEKSENCTEEKRITLPKQESVVLYTQAALSGGKMSIRKGRKPRTVLLKQPSNPSDVGTGLRRPLLKQERRMSTGDRIAMFFSRSHKETNTPDIVISGSVDNENEDEEEDGPRTPLPVLPIVLPEGDSDEENQADKLMRDKLMRDKMSKLPKFLKVTKRYRRSSLVRMDAVKQPGTNTNALKGTEEETCRRISVHGSLDLKKGTLKDLSEFRNAVSFSAADPKEEEDMIAITELNSSGDANLLDIPREPFGGHRRRGSKKKRPSLRRFLTLAAEPKLNREELEERHSCRKKEREERRKEKRERKLKEKQRMEEEKYDEDGVSKFSFRKFYYFPEIFAIRQFLFQE